MLHSIPSGIISSAAGTAVTAAFASSAVDGTNDGGATPTYTLSSLSLSTAAADRQIVVAVDYYSSAGRTVTSVTVGGVSASLDLQLTRASQGQSGLEIWRAAVPTGTTGDVVVVFSGGTVLRMGVALHAIYGASTGAVNDTVTSTASPGTGTIDCPAGGVVISAANVNAVGTPTYTLVGVDETYDEVVEASEMTHGGGFKEYAAIQTGLTVSATYSASSEQSFCAVSYGV